MKHPSRYPNHDGDKGTVYGGVCNRTACDHPRAEWFNRCTYGYYCGTDAHAINFERHKFPVCIPVDHDLSMEEMEETVNEFNEGRWPRKAALNI